MIRFQVFINLIASYTERETRWKAGEFSKGRHFTSPVFQWDVQILFPRRLLSSSNCLFFPYSSFMGFWKVETWSSIFIYLKGLIMEVFIMFSMRLFSVKERSLVKAIGGSCQKIWETWTFHFLGYDTYNSVGFALAFARWHHCGEAVIRREIHFNSASI